MKATETTLKPELPIEYLRLPERARNALLNAGVLTIRDVCVEIHQDTLMAIKGVGIKMAEEITKTMASLGYEKDTALSRR
jgi:DNA-directed RNA polymerase alpha subunit